MKYFDEVKAAVEAFINDELFDNFEFDENTSTDEFEQSVYDYCFIDDAITGNGSGSYTFSREQAKENVLADFETVYEALCHFDVGAEKIGERFLAQDWEYFDVTARCFVLGSVCAELAEEWASKKWHIAIDDAWAEGDAERIAELLGKASIDSELTEGEYHDIIYYGKELLRGFRK